MMEVNNQDPSVLVSGKVHAAKVVRLIAHTYPATPHGKIHAYLSDVANEISRKVPRLSIRLAPGTSLVDMSDWIVDDHLELLIAGVGIHVYGTPSAQMMAASLSVTCKTTYNKLYNRLLFEEYGINGATNMR